MKQKRFSWSAQLDEHITELLQRVRSQHARPMETHEPEMRMARDVRHAYQAEAGEDARSLERVLSRLVDEKAAGRPKVIFLSQTERKQERALQMQDTNDMFTEGTPKKSAGRLLRRVSLLAAVLCVIALVGGFLTVLNAAHTTKPTSQTLTAASHTATTTPATPVPTVKDGPVGTIVYHQKTSSEPMSWSPVGNLVAGIGNDGTSLETWNALTGANVVKYRLPFQEAGQNFLMATAWSFDSTEVAFQYSNGIAVFNAQSGAVITSWSAKSNHSFQGVAFLPDGKYLVTTSFATSFTNGGQEQVSNAHLNVFSIATGQLVAQPQDKVYVNMVASPTGKYLIAGGASEAVGQGTAWDLWDTTSWSIVRTYTNVADFSWSPDGSQIALVRNGSVQIVDAQSDNVLRSFASGAGTIANIAWQPHGTRLLVNTVNASAQTSYLSLWDTQTGTHLYTLNSYQGAFNDGSAWSSDGKYVLFSAFSTKTSSTVTPAATQTPPLVQPPVAQWDEVIWIAG